MALFPEIFDVGFTSEIDEGVFGVMGVAKDQNRSRWNPHVKDVWLQRTLLNARGSAWLGAHATRRLARTGTPPRSVACWQPPAGWRDRVPLHQVHPLLVHAALFGGGYGSQAVSAARRYA